MSRFKIFLYGVLFVNNFMCAQTFNWGALINTNNTLSASDIAVDAMGNTYTVGFLVEGTDFDPGPNIFTLSDSGNNLGNVFCVKLGPNGNFIWAINVGGTNSFDASNLGGVQPHIAIDKAGGFIYITGVYNNNVDFDPSPAVFLIPQPPNQTGGDHRFLAKYTLNKDLVWARYMGSDAVYTDIAINSAGIPFLTGNIFSSVDIDSGPNVYMLINTSNTWDMFILRLDTLGNFVSCIQLGDITRNDFINDIEFDNQDNFIVTGNFRGLVDFDPSSTTNNIQSNNNSFDAFVAKYSSQGALIWVRTFGSAGTASESGRSLTIDNQNDVYITGKFAGTIDFDPGPGVFNLPPVGLNSIFILKLDANGNFGFAKTIGPVNFSSLPFDIAVDNIGGIYITGQYLTSMDCDPDEGVFTVTANGGNNDIFLVSLSSVNGSFKWAKSIGGTGIDEGKRIAIYENTNRLTLIGQIRTSGTPIDFDAPNGIFLPHIVSSNHSFIVNYSYNTLSNEDFSVDNRYTIYPNPANDYVTITAAEPIKSLILLDISGKIIANKNNSNTLNLSGIKPGIYIIKISGNNSGNLVSKKIIVK